MEIRGRPRDSKKETAGAPGQARAVKVFKKAGKISDRSSHDLQDPTRNLRVNVEVGPELVDKFLNSMR
jgi:hypothetical protein